MEKQPGEGCFFVLYKDSYPHIIGTQDSGWWVCTMKKIPLWDMTQQMVKHCTGKNNYCNQFNLFHYLYAAG